MHIVFSEVNDQSTNDVLDWLIKEEAPFIRYNGKSERSNDFQNSEITLSPNWEDVNIKLNDGFVIGNVQSVWFRRPNKKLDDFYSIHDYKDFIIPPEEMKKWIEPHYSVLKEFLTESISNKRTLGSYSVTGLNKPRTLKIAKEIGLKIPKTIITNSYEKVNKFFEANNSKIVCKPLHESLMYFSEKEKFWFLNYTKLIESMDEIKHQFGVSLFQECIEKEYEIRVVYIDGELYPMAIFSQNNKKTIIDFRNYDMKKPNRMVPYRLPLKIKNLITELMHTVDLNMGSIDLIKDCHGDIYFLEINPVGQFGFVSDFCNYHLEKKIAEFLLNKPIQ